MVVVVVVSTEAVAVAALLGDAGPGVVANRQVVSPPYFKRDLPSNYSSPPKHGACCDVEGA